MPGASRSTVVSAPISHVWQYLTSSRFAVRRVSESSVVDPPDPVIDRVGSKWTVGSTLGSTVLVTDYEVVGLTDSEKLSIEERSALGTTVKSYEVRPDGTRTRLTLTTRRSWAGDRGLGALVDTVGTFVFERFIVGYELKELRTTIEEARTR